MAESSALLPSDTPPIENLGFEPLIHDRARVDPIATDSFQPSGSSQNAPAAGNGASLDGENVTPREDVEFGNSIERELLRLTITQAEIEAAQESLGTDDEAQGKHVRPVKNEDVDEHNKKVGDCDIEENEGVEVGKDTQMRGGHVKEEKDEQSESTEQEKENERGGMEGERNVSIQNRSNNRRRINYPMRSDAEDCAYYMKFGSCKFGFSCKFNHPPRRKNQIKDKAKNREENTDRAGQTECKYYLTSEGCRYGKDCKYSHGLDRSSSSHNPEFNFLGLPIRPGEKECPYYMRTGSCKYGLSCRFHHPDPKTVPGGGSPSGYGNAIFPPTQGGTTSTQEWNGYQGSTYQTSEKSLPTPPVLAMNNIPTEISLALQHKRVMAAEEYPERPGEPECSFFLKTGDCKFKSNCKFHHPKSHHSHAKVNSISFNKNGLPLRPDQPVCTYYHRYGICKYGPACKYDHSSMFASSDRAERMGQGNETGS